MHHGLAVGGTRAAARRLCPCSEHECTAVGTTLGYIDPALIRATNLERNRGPTQHWEYTWLVARVREYMGHLLFTNCAITKCTCRRTSKMYHHERF